MTVNFYNLSKRYNEIKLPGTPNRAAECALKEPCSILNPAIRVSFAVYAYNYCYIPQWGRYYYISNAEYERGEWVAYLAVDVLNSWDDEIYATSAQVIFSANNYSLDLIDNRIPATGKINRQVSTEPFTGALAASTATATGYFALTGIAKTGGWPSGVATTYFLNVTQMLGFAQELLNPDIWEEMRQFFDNPMDAIVECYYLPIDVSQYINLSSNIAIEIGGYTFSATGRTPQGSNLAEKSMHTTISLPWPYDDFRRLSPYTSVELFVPFCGSTPIAPESIYNVDQIFLDYGVDVTTGNVQCIAYIKETVLAEMSGNCKISLPIGQTQSRVDQVLSAGSGVVSAIAGFASGNVALGAVGTLSAIGSAMSPATQKTMGGMSGSILGAILGMTGMTWQKFRISITSHTTYATPSSIRSIMGGVNGDVLQLSVCSGFTQTAGASVSATASDEELRMINALLDSGVFL